MDDLQQSSTAVDYDALSNEISTPEPGRAMRGEPEPVATPDAQTPAAEPEWSPVFDKYGFKWNGKDLNLNLTKKEDYERARTYIQQGYDYSQKMAQFKNEYGPYLNLGAQRLGQYSEIDQFAKQNPQWWQHVEKSWSEREQQPGQAVANDPLTSLKTELEQKFEQKFSSLEESIHGEKRQQKAAEEDSALDQEIKGVRETYPHYNFDQIMTDDGKTLEFQVFEHAQKIGTNSFKAAFRDFYHDQIIKDAELRANETAVKNRQEMAKKGLLGTSQTPKKGLNPVQNIKNRSYDDLVNEGLRELGITI